MAKPALDGALESALVVFLDKLESIGLWSDQTIRLAIAASEPYLSVDVDIGGPMIQKPVSVTLLVDATPKTLTLSPSTGTDESVITVFRTQSDIGEVIIDSVWSGRTEYVSIVDAEFFNVDHWTQVFWMMSQDEPLSITARSFTDTTHMLWIAMLMQSRTIRRELMTLSALRSSSHRVKLRVDGPHELVDFIMRLAGGPGFAPR